ncbi:hypothetical protein PAAG_11681 [Paracoccidioides lutzii Pb01]|uniref:Uncharacterized protein n=1 Tax=Paracoccidioides lutzii (strain ATCC MYA-826 / Pb01) TaxID=502779 RepID=A0A0A2V5C8_PARBA|nr:hypothetical protein PAAG_11681 [Paracoccidioides lutzii Pb01]KGQ01557.1 hypothetical protein PAAG_11681 [Paracoccidioides lutzii Pb01]
MKESDVMGEQRGREGETVEVEVDYGGVFWGKDWAKEPEPEPEPEPRAGDGAGAGDGDGDGDGLVALGWRQAKFAHRLRSQQQTQQPRKNTTGFQRQRTNSITRLRSTLSAKFICFHWSSFKGHNP